MPRRPKRLTQGLLGSRKANAALTEGEVLAIRQALDAGQSPRELSQIHGVGIEQVRRIGRRESWGWLPDRLEIPDSLETLPELTAAQKEDMERIRKGALEIMEKKAAEASAQEKKKTPTSVSDTVKARKDQYLKDG